MDFVFFIFYPILCLCTKNTASSGFERTVFYAFFFLRSRYRVRTGWCMFTGFAQHKVTNEYFISLYDLFIFLSSI